MTYGSLLTKNNSRKKIAKEIKIAQFKHPHDLAGVEKFEKKLEDIRDNPPSRLQAVLVSAERFCEHVWL